METEFSTRRSLVALIVGLAAVVTVLTVWVGWALPVVVGAIIIMVMGHEFGHYITAKRSGMEVTDFFVGFGPVLWSTKIGETRYGVRAILAGGYVKVPGMSWSDTKVDAAQESRTYRSATYPRKVLFASAGSLMHGVMALLLAFASLTLVGSPSASHVGIVGFTPWDAHVKNAAQTAGLRLGDRIVSIDGRLITSANQLVNTVHADSSRRIILVVERQGRDITLRATPVDGRTIKVGGTPLSTGAKPDGYLGIELNLQTVRTSWWNAIPQSFTSVGSMIGVATHAMIHVFSPGEFASLFHQVASPAAATNRANQLTRPESIVGVVRIAVQSTQNGPGTLLAILMTVNIFVGLLNMIPMLPLDGGYVAVATYERLRSRRGAPRYHADINRLAPVVYAFMTVLLVLFASTLYLDVVHPIANPFH
jgi:membrane-associated protease RseP (regulator of RpoE activity)